MSWKFIDKVGLELEGGWNYLRNDLVKEGSLYQEHFKNSVCFGELVSEPIASEQEVIDYLLKNWPTETQIKCGYHIHFSLKDVNLYSSCMSQKFLDGFIEHIKKWAEKNHCRNPYFLDRLSGNNHFCRHKFNPDQQVNLRKKGTEIRYTVFNFCYAMHKTIECRLFPTFNEAKWAVSATKALLDYVESYLEANKISDLEVRFDFSPKRTVVKNEIESINKLQSKSNKIRSLTPKPVSNLTEAAIAIRNYSYRAPIVEDSDEEPQRVYVSSSSAGPDSNF